MNDGPVCNASIQSIVKMVVVFDQGDTNYKS